MIKKKQNNIMKMTKKGCKSNTKLIRESFKRSERHKKREYGGNRCENMSEEDKPKLKGCGKTVLIEKIA